MGNRICPCSSCTKVEDPKKCDNKGCKVWKAWFVRQWDKMCSHLLEEGL